MAAGRLLALLGCVALACADDFTVQFTIQLDSSHRADATVTVRESKAPIGAQRFRELVNSGFFNGAPLYRVVPGLFVQFGLSPNVTLQRQWDKRGTLADETRIEHPDWNMRGTVAFVTSGPHSRATQLIINYDDNHQLDAAGFVPFGRVVKGMHVFSSVYSGYRERPQANEIRRKGLHYLQSEFPRLSYIIEAKQVAFVEEPMMLSKNFTGLIITFIMVLVAGICCTAAKALQKHLLAKGQGYKETAGMPRYPDEETDVEDDHDDGPNSNPGSTHGERD